MTSPATTAAVLIESFGYRHGPPLEGPEMIFDVRRRFRDPGVADGLRRPTGGHPAVVQAVMGTPGVEALIGVIVAAARACLFRPEPGPAVVAVGCSGGRHRSVVNRRRGGGPAVCGGRADRTDPPAVLALAIRAGLTLPPTPARLDVDLEWMRAEPFVRAMVAALGEAGRVTLGGEIAADVLRTMRACDAFAATVSGWFAAIASVWDAMDEVEYIALALAALGRDVTDEAVHELASGIFAGLARQQETSDRRGAAPAAGQPVCELAAAGGRECLWRCPASPPPRPGSGKPPPRSRRPRTGRTTFISGGRRGAGRP